MKRGVLAAEARRERVGHLVARRDEAVDHAAVRARPRRSRRSRGSLVRSVVVDDDAAALADREAGARARARRAAGCPPRRSTMSTGERRAVREAQRRAPRRRRASASVCAPRCTCTPSASIARAQDVAAGGVELARHQARRELDDVRLEPEVAHRLRRLEAEQAAADHRGAPRARAAQARIASRSSIVR